MTTDIRIEPWVDNDLELLRGANAPEMTEHLGGPESEEKLLDRHRRYLELSDPAAGRMFRVVLLPGGEAVGIVGYWQRVWQDVDVYETGWQGFTRVPGPGHRDRCRRCGRRRGPRAANAQLHPRVSVGRERGVQRDPAQARVRTRRRVRLRVPAGPHDAVQR